MSGPSPTSHVPPDLARDANELGLPPSGGGRSGHDDVAARHDHYEKAFEDYLRARGVPFVSVEEARRAVLTGARIKSFDYLVYPVNGPNWLVDVKGRKFPYQSGGAKRYWESWVTERDVEGLLKWEEVFGEGFAGAFVFAYGLTGPEDSWPSAPVHECRGRRYAFLMVTVQEYDRHCRTRSPKWGTVSVPTSAFKKIVRPATDYLEPSR